MEWIRYIVVILLLIVYIYFARRSGEDGFEGLSDEEALRYRDTIRENFPEKDTVKLSGKFTEWSAESVILYRNRSCEVEKPSFRFKDYKMEPLAMFGGRWQQGTEKSLENSSYVVKFSGVFESGEEKISIDLKDLFICMTNKIHSCLMYAAKAGRKEINSEVWINKSDPERPKILVINFLDYKISTRL
jgi:hypothetical protein